MTAAFLEINRFVAEQALLEARRSNAPRELARARRVMHAIDKRKSVKRWQRLEG